jgi:hypothetical protein
MGNPAKIPLQICPAAYIFIWPLLSFAAEESNSWEHLGTLCTGHCRQQVDSSTNGATASGVWPKNQLQSPFQGDCLETLDKGTFFCLFMVIFLPKVLN